MKGENKITKKEFKKLNWLYKLNFLFDELGENKVMWELIENMNGEELLRVTNKVAKKYHLLEENRKED